MSSVDHYPYASARDPELGRLILAATIEVVTRHGYDQATAQMIAEQAGTTTAEVIRRFGDKEACCLHAFEDVCEQLDCLLLPIYLRPEPWEDRIPAAASAAARYCREHEDNVRFAIEERFRGGREAMGESSLRLHLRQVDSIRWEVAEPDRIPAIAADLAVGAFLEALLSLHAEGRLAEFEDGVPDLLYSAFRLYLGAEAAEQVLARCRSEKEIH